MVSLCVLPPSLSLRSPSSPEDFLTLAISSFPRLMPWEVALACSVCTDKSHDLGRGSHDLGRGPHDPGLYVTYLSRLFSNPGHQNLQGIITEVFESDHTLLSLSLSVVLVESGRRYDHTHTKEGLPRYALWALCIDC